MEKEMRVRGMHVSVLFTPFSVLLGVFLWSVVERVREEGKGGKGREKGVSI